jgi:Patatin-like phospholipase
VLVLWDGGVILFWGGAVKFFNPSNLRVLPGADEAVHHEHGQLIGLEDTTSDALPEQDLNFWQRLLAKLQSWLPKKPKLDRSPKKSGTRHNSLFKDDQRNKRGLIEKQIKIVSAFHLKQNQSGKGNTKAKHKGQVSVAVADNDAKFVWAQGERLLADRAHDQGKALAAGTSTSQQPPATSGYLGDGVFPTAGLALSGGGIRSAAFCAGAMQGLAAHKINSDESAFGLFDYLSTVSGGGYIGSTVSLNSAASQGFNLLDPTGERKDSETMKSIRNGTNYLKFGRLLPTIFNIVIYMRGLIVNFFMVAFVLLLLAAVTLLANKSHTSLTKPDIFGIDVPPEWTLTPYLAITVGLLVLLILFNIFWANVISFRPPERAGLQSEVTWLPVALLTIICGAFLLELQPLVVHNMIGPPIDKAIVSGCGATELESHCTDAQGHLLPLGHTCKPELVVRSCKKPGVDNPKSGAEFNGGPFSKLFDWLKYLLGPFLAIVTVFSQTLGEYFKSEEVQTGWTAFIKRNASRIIVWSAGIIFFALLWVLYLYLVYWGIDMSKADAEYDRSVPLAISRIFDWWRSECPNWKNIGWLYMFSSLVIFCLTALLHPNANSLHRLYRDRLGQSFCFVQNGQEKLLVHDVKLSQLQKKRPIHIINTAINLQRSKVVKSMGRKADFFMFTPYRIGSVATGYAPTRQMEQLNSGSDIDIATATAISGAAFSSNMGSVSMKPLAPLLAFLNVRLGHWFPNPKLVKGQSALQPNFWYLANEAMGNLHENRDKIYLTDGGHIENLGVFELLRRRCRLIVAIDAEADPNMAFTSFVQLQRFARIDLGARIEMSWSQIAATSIESMSCKSGAKKGPHCAIGKIIYDNGGMGIVLYIKSSVTGDENDYVREYNRRNSIFPHETTGDQFFSEEQFEVYRALGFHIVSGLLSGEHLVQTSAGLEHLDDIKAKGEAVAEAAMLLGVVQKNHDPAPAQPIIHHLKMMA